MVVLDASKGLLFDSSGHVHGGGFGSSSAAHGSGRGRGRGLRGVYRDIHSHIQS